MGVLECALANSVIPTLLLPLAFIFLPEFNKWGDELGGHAQSATIVITLLCVSVTLCKHADRFCKFKIVSLASTMFYAAIDSNMKVVAGIGAFLFFNETIYWPQVVGFVFILSSLLVMYYDKKAKMAKKLLEAQVKYESRRSSLASVPDARGSVNSTVSTPLSKSASNPILQDFVVEMDAVVGAEVR
jgi:hypothetical protein